MPEDAYRRGNQPIHIRVSFNYLVNFDSEVAVSEDLLQNLAFRLGYDDAEIPFNEKVLIALKSEISEVLPRNINIDRLGGELSFNGEKIKTF